MEVTALQPRAPTNLVEAKAKADAISRALRRAARQSRMPTPLISGGSGFRARKGDRAFRLGVLLSFIVLVVCPTLAASVYWGLIASDQYATISKFALRSGESSILDSFGGLAGLPGSQQSQDSQILVNYIQSRGMVEALEKQVDLKRIFSRGDADSFSRLPADEPIETIEKYWRRRVDVSIETISGIITVNIRAFSPQESLLLSQKVLELSENLVNDISTRSRRDTLAQSQAELTRAENRLQKASAAMRDARNAEGVLDAGASAEAINKIITVLRLQLLQVESDLAAQGAASSSPQAKVLNERIANLKQQIADYSRKIAGGTDENMAGRLGVLSGVQVDLDLARQQYALAAVTFENARIDLETQHAYIAPFLQPTLAEKSVYPRRWWEWSIIALPSLLIWSLLVGVAFLVRDHMAK